MIVGVLGGGQLGQMLALAGTRLGLSFRFLDPAADSVAARVGDLIVAPYTDEAALARLTDGAAVVTYEFENVPARAAAFLESHASVYPPASVLATAQDRLLEKQLFQRLDIPTPPFAPVASEADLHAAVDRLGLPAVLKTRHGGYDGKGQHVLRTPADIPAAWAALGGKSDEPRATSDEKKSASSSPSSLITHRSSLILESFVPFDREVSILAVRSRTSELAFYPLVENEHRAGILRVSRAPIRHPDPALEHAAQDFAARVLAEFNYVGLLAIEFFVKDGRLLANEMAPRVHNSGHWTQDGAATDQFENHLRAILGLPLGPTTPRGSAAMVNLIGDHPPLADLLALPAARVHLYGKSPRPARKLGHINLCVPTDADRQAAIARVLAAIAPAHAPR